MRSAPLEECIQELIPINTETPGHDDTWIGEVVFRGLRENQHVSLTFKMVDRQSCMG